MDDSSNRRREAPPGKDAQDPTKRGGSWEDLCVQEVESESSAEALFSAERQNVEQKLWLSFQSTASAIAQLCRGRDHDNEEMWVAFQTAAEIATNLYRASVDGTRSVSELAVQCGYHRRNKELLSWAKKRKRHLRREDLIGYLCGRSPPRRLSRSPSSARGPDSPDHRRSSFHECAPMSGLSGPVDGTSLGGDAAPQRATPPARNFQQNLPSFLPDEMMRRGDSVPSSSLKRHASSHNPSSPKRRR